MVGDWLGKLSGQSTATADPDLTASDAAEELERIKQKAITICDAALTYGRPFLLSDLGHALGTDATKIRLITRRRLSDFVREHLSENYNLVVSGKHNGVYAIIPKSWAEEPPKRVPDASPSSKARFHHRFWSAFAVPLAAGMRRHLNLDTFYFYDTPIDTAGPSGTVIVEAEFIPPSETEDRNAVVARSIERWIAKQGFSSSQFMVDRKPQSTHPSVEQGSSLLELMFEALDRRQLQSVSMSLDVVAALSRRRIKR